MCLSVEVCSFGLRATPSSCSWARCLLPHDDPWFRRWWWRPCPSPRKSCSSSPNTQPPLSSTRSRQTFPTSMSRHIQRRHILICNFWFASCPQDAGQFFSDASTDQHPLALLTPYQLHIASLSSFMRHPAASSTASWSTTLTPNPASAASDAAYPSSSSFPPVWGPYSL